MKAKTLFLLLILFTGKTLLAQIIKGTIIDADTKKHIVYAHIGIENKSIGTISDENGNFEINITNTTSSDIISFSSVGYKKKSIPLDQIGDKHLTISLNRHAYNLNQITIEEKRLIKKSKKAKKIGRKRGRGNYTGSSRIGWGGEIGIKINAKNKLYKVKNANFKIMEISHDSILFSLNIYSIKNSLPFESLLNEPIYIMGKKGETWVSGDLSDKNVFFKNDVIVTIESVKAWSSDNRGFGVFYSNGILYNSKTYFKESSMGQWRIGKDPKLTLYLTIEQYKTK